MIRRALSTTLALQLLLVAAAGCTIDDDTSRRDAPSGQKSVERFVPPPPDERARYQNERGVAGDAGDFRLASSSEASGGEGSPAGIDETMSVSGDAEADASVESFKDRESALLVGREAFARGEHERARAALAFALEKGEGVEAGEPVIASAYDVYLLGLASWKSGELEEAERLLVEAGWRLENFSRAPLNLARVRLELGEHEAAREAVETAIELEPTLAAAHNVHGRVLLAMGDRDGAYEAFARAEELDPTNPWPPNNLGYAHLVAGDAGSALPPLERAVAIDEDFAIAWHNLALALEQSGRGADATLAAARAAELDAGRERYAATLARLDALVPVSEAELLVARRALEESERVASEEGALAAKSESSSAAEASPLAEPSVLIESEAGQPEASSASGEAESGSEELADASTSAAPREEPSGF